MRSAWLAAALRALAARSPLALINGVIPPHACRVSEGIAYGPRPRQQLDIYMPWRADGAPVAVFLYGGSWRSGNRGDYKLGHELLVGALARPLRWRAPVLDDLCAFLGRHRGRGQRKTQP